jgi:hypothetical protein
MQISVCTSFSIATSTEGWWRQQGLLRSSGLRLLVRAPWRYERSTSAVCTHDKEGIKKTPDHDVTTGVAKPKQCAPRRKPEIT